MFSINVTGDSSNIVKNFENENNNKLKLGLGKKYKPKKFIEQGTNVK
jgi:hypothetical protein